MRYTATTQALAIGDAVQWFRASDTSCCDGTAVATIAPRLKGCGKCGAARYLVAAHVIVAATAAAGIQLALEVDGVRYPANLIAFPAATDGAPLSADVVTEVPANCCGSRVALVAVTAVPLVAAQLVIQRTN